MAYSDDLLNFTSRPSGDQNNWDVPLKGVLNDHDAGMETLTSAVAGLSGLTVSPFGGVVNVKDYGATGNGTTDDTTAIINARNAVFASTVNGGHCTKALYFPAGIYRVTQAGALMNSPNAGGANQSIIRSYRVLGESKRASEIFFDVSGAPAAGAHPGSLSPFVCGNRVNHMRIEKINLRTNNSNATAFFFWSRNDDVSAPQPQDYPEYGIGNNQDIIFKEVQMSGSWRWGYLFDGDAQCNLNSEVFLYNCAVTNSTTFATALFQVGYTNWENYSQQDQMVNYSFEDCKFEYKSGDCLVFNRGGAVMVRGGSWILGIGDDTAQTGGTMFKTGNVTVGHNDAATQAVFHSLRFELRNVNCRLFDVAWSGSNSHLSFYDCSDTANSFKSFGPNVQSRIRVRSGAICNIRAQQCTLGGHWLVIGAQTGVGRIVFDQCGFKNFATGGVGTSAAASTFLRYDTTTVPKYRYRDCSGAADASN